MASKTFLLLALAFAVVLLMSTEVSAVKDQLATDHNSELEDAKNGHYKVDGRSGYDTTSDDDEGDNNPGTSARCRYRCCRYSPRGWCIRCCRSKAEAVAFEQTRN